MSAAFVSRIFTDGVGNKNATEKCRRPKGDTVEDRRVRLIERLCRLPERHLADVEAMLVHLERDSAIESRTNTVDTSSTPLVPAHKDWPHAPVHRLSEHGTYIVTASTHHQQHFFRGSESLTLLEDKLLELEAARRHSRSLGRVLESLPFRRAHYRERKSDCRPNREPPFRDGRRSQSPRQPAGSSSLVQLLGYQVDVR